MAPAHLIQVNLCVTDQLLLLQSLWFQRKCSMLCHSRLSSLYDYSISSKVNYCHAVSSEPLLPELVKHMECFFPNLYFETCLESQGCRLIPHSYLLSCFCCVVVLLFLSCLFSVNGSFSWLFFLYRKLFKRFSLRVWIFCAVPVEQLGDDSW